MVVMMNNLFKVPLSRAVSSESFECLLQTGDLLIERIISAGQSTPEGIWYDQDKEEWVVLLQGKSRLVFDGGEIIEMVAGDWIHIPAHRKHRVEYTSSDPVCIWLAVHWK